MPFRASPWLLSALLSLLLATESMAQVSGNTGSFRTSIPIAVPTFQGLEPRLSLSYSSSGGNGTVGVGWARTGFSYIERQGADGGSPNYDSTDSFRLGGADLHPCGASASPGCLAGGTHFTEHESYQRITFDGSLEWTVDARNGTTSTYTPVLSVASQTFRWGLTSVTDTLGNTVTYNWWCDGTDDCYPVDVTYNGYRVKFHCDGSRSDHLSFATGASIAEMGQRLQTIEVGLTDGTAIRAYALQYSTSPSTGRSLLDSVQMYGTDVVIDAGGVITGGSSLPVESFTYTTDASHDSFTDGSSWGVGCTKIAGTGDFNGDGLQDVYCHADSAGDLDVGLSDGTSFTFSDWGPACGSSADNLSAGDFNGERWRPGITPTTI